MCVTLDTISDLLHQISTMLFNTVVCCAVLAAAVSAFTPLDENVGKVRKDGALYRHVVDCKSTMLKIASISSSYSLSCLYINMHSF